MTTMQTPRVAVVLGGSGQIGRCMVAELKQQWPNVQLLSPSRAQLDLSDAHAVMGYLQHHQPDWLINCAAYTAVDAAEQDLPSPDLADEQSSHPNTQLNACLPQWLAQYWQQSDKVLTLLHFSSDYVYSGAGDLPWREDQTPAPINAYGRAKAAGDSYLLTALQGTATARAMSASEQLLTAAESSRLFILRTSWVYHTHGQNFVNTMLRLAGERDVLRVVDDQCGAPTPAAWAAQISTLLLNSQARSGLYHLAPAGVTSWYGVAYAALSSAAQNGLITQVPELIAIRSEDYPTAAKRPCNSRLDCQKLQTELGIEFADWHSLLRQHMATRS